MSALQDAVGAAGGPNPSLIAPLLSAVCSPVLCTLFLRWPRPPGTDEALAAWCAAALRAGALPALRRVMAMARRGRGVPAVVVDAASVASLVALIPEEPVAGAASAAARGAGAAGAPNGPRLGWLAGLAGQWRRPDEAQWLDDPAVAAALEILLGCVAGAPAWCWGAPRK
jgi:hypothetical protein